MLATQKKTLPLLYCLIIAILLLSGCGAPAAKEPREGSYGKVELLRDRLGCAPRICLDRCRARCTGWAMPTAQDRAFQMYYNLRIIQGRLAELVGDVKVGVAPPAASGQDISRPQRCRDANDRLLSGGRRHCPPSRPRIAKPARSLQPGC